jgi:hypothetical protein
MSERKGIGVEYKIEKLEILYRAINISLNYKKRKERI